MAPTILVHIITVFQLYADRFRKHEVMYPKRLAAYFENMKQEERFAYCMHKLRRESNIAHRKMREMRRKLGKPLLALRNPFKLFVHDHYTVDVRVSISAKTVDTRCRRIRIQILDGHETDNEPASSRVENAHKKSTKLCSEGRVKQGTCLVGRS